MRGCQGKGNEHDKNVFLWRLNESSTNALHLINPIQVASKYIPSNRPYPDDALDNDNGHIFFWHNMA